MANYSMNDPEYWETPDRYQPLVAGNTKRRATFFAIGDIEDEETAIAAVLDMPPGYVIPRHAHDCERFEVVAKGSIDVGDKILYPGDIMTARPNELYGPKVAGPEGCTTIEFFSRQRGIAGPLRHELDDGSIVEVEYLKGERPPGNLGGMDGIAEKVAAVLAVANGGKA